MSKRPTTTKTAPATSTDALAGDILGGAQAQSTVLPAGLVTAAAKSVAMHRTDDEGGNGDAPAPKKRRKRPAGKKTKGTPLRWTQMPSDEFSPSIVPVPLVLDNSSSRDAGEEHDPPRLQPVVVAEYSYTPCNRATHGIVLSAMRAAEKDDDNEKIFLVGKMSVRASAVFRRRGHKKPHASAKSAKSTKSAKSSKPDSSSDININFEVNYAMMTLEDARRLVKNAVLVVKRKGSPNKNIDQSLVWNPRGEMDEDAQTASVDDAPLLGDSRVRALVRPVVRTTSTNTPVDPKGGIFMFACKYKDYPVIYATEAHKVVFLLLQTIGKGPEYEISKASNSKAVYYLFQNEVKVGPCPPPAYTEGGVRVNAMLKYVEDEESVQRDSPEMDETTLPPHPEFIPVLYKDLHSKRTATAALDAFFPKAVDKCSPCDGNKEEEEEEGEEEEEEDDDEEEDEDEDEEEDDERRKKNRKTSRHTTRDEATKKNGGGANGRPTTAGKTIASYRTMLPSSRPAPRTNTTPLAERPPLLTASQITEARRGKRLIGAVHDTEDHPSTPARKRRATRPAHGSGRDEESSEEEDDDEDDDDDDVIMGETARYASTRRSSTRKGRQRDILDQQHLAVYRSMTNAVAGMTTAVAEMAKALSAMTSE